MGVKEARHEDYLEDRAAKLGGIAPKHTSPGRAGDPDRIVAVPMTPCPCCGSRARFGLLEAKATAGRTPRPLQLARIGEYLQLGVPAGWAGDRAMVDAFLARLTRPMGWWA